MRFILIISLFLSLVSAEYFDSFDAMLIAAKNSHKIPVVVLTSSHCPWCKKLKSESLYSSDFSKQIDDKFAIAILDKDNDDYPKSLCATFVPTTYFLDYTNDTFWQSVGYKSKERYIGDYKAALETWNDFYASN